MAGSHAELANGCAGPGRMSKLPVIGDAGGSPQCLPRGRPDDAGEAEGEAGSESLSVSIYCFPQLSHVARRGRY